MRRLAIYLIPLILLPAAGCRMELQHGLGENQANEILVLLQTNRIDADKRPEEGGRERTWMVTVPEKDAPRAFELLQRHELPRPSLSGFDTVFAEPGLIPTGTEERARYLGALNGELARTLETMDGVLRARVHIVMPEPDPLRDPGRDPVRPTAAVLLKLRAGDLPELSDSSVRELVASSVQDLEPGNVSVLRTMARSEPAPSVESEVPLSPQGFPEVLHAMLLSALAAVAGLSVAVMWLAVTVRNLRRRSIRPGAALTEPDTGTGE